jgi:hypothetical protein
MFFWQVSESYNRIGSEWLTSNIWSVKRGKAAPKRERTTPFAAMTEAA